MAQRRWGRWLRRGWPWAPVCVLSVLWVARGLAGTLGLDLRTFLLAGAIFAAWWLARRLWLTAAIAAALLIPEISYQFIHLPAAAQALERVAAVPGQTYVRVAGTVRRQRSHEADGQAYMTLLLGEAAVEPEAKPGSLELAEVAVELPVHERWFRFHGRQRIRIGAALDAVTQAQGRLLLRLSDADYHFETETPSSAERLRTALADRAAYYLQKPALATYLPVVLGILDRSSPEAREVVRVFRRTGVAHLFAISGLHVGLLYLIFIVVVHHAIGLALRGQGLRYAREGLRVGVLAMIWLYLALIGFPVSAVRAAVMGSLFVLADLWGARTPRIYILTLTALLVLAVHPSQIYDLSFQLSFLAYGCLLFAFAPGAAERPPQHALPRLAWQVLRVVGMNLRSTLLITLGTWPLVSAVFGTVPLLAFAANLLMIPLLSLIVLPCAVAALAASLVHLGSVPGGTVERAVFWVLEAVIGVWLVVIEAINRWGSVLVLRYRMDWPHPAIFAYYVLFAAGIWAWWQWRQRGPRPAVGSAAAPGLPAQ